MKAVAKNVMIAVVLAANPAVVAEEQVAKVEDINYVDEADMEKLDDAEGRELSAWRSKRRRRMKALNAVAKLAAAGKPFRERLGQGPVLNALAKAAERLRGFFGGRNLSAEDNNNEHKFALTLGGRATSARQLSAGGRELTGEVDCVATITGKSDGQAQCYAAAGEFGIGCDDEECRFVSENGNNYCSVDYVIPANNRSPDEELLLANAQAFGQCCQLTDGGCPSRRVLSEKKTALRAARDEERRRLGIFRNRNTPKKNLFDAVDIAVEYYEEVEEQYPQRRQLRGSAAAHRRLTTNEQVTLAHVQIDAGAATLCEFDAETYANSEDTCNALVGEWDNCRDPTYNSDEKICGYKCEQRTSDMSEAALLAFRNGGYCLEE